MQDTVASPSREITKMHNTHTQWRSEHAAWTQEIASWQREQQQAAVTIYRIERTPPERKSLLDTHADHIKMHEIEDHEKILAKLMIGQGVPAPTHNCSKLTKMQ